MSPENPEASQEISASFIETLVLIHRKFYRNLAVPVPLNQFATLMTLRLEKNASVTEIGKNLLISKQQMSNICEKLLQAGFISKRPDPEDRRRTLVSLTKAGEKLIDDQNEIVRRKFLRSLSNLSTEEQNELRDSIVNFNHYVEKMNTAPSK
ncbi:MarR family winged helix-turn-helix transcriptional regulator [Mitsuokella sp.]|uniref:MarR family winged helix-turn-helix transcriptional regulator n=1 Tax=unclassified Mitsuokella TaxID=2637239 RepID=UPI003D7DF4D8